MARPTKWNKEIEEKAQAYINDYQMYGDMIPSPTDSFTPEVKVDSFLSKIFQPIKNQVDRFSNWWRELFKEEMIKDIRG